MKLNEAFALLKKSSGENPYKIYIPSMKQEVTFRPLTAGMQKTLSRIAVDDNSASGADYKLTQLACIKALSISPIDVMELTDLDFLAVLATIRLNNKLDPLGLVMPCKCGAKINFNLDCESIIKAVKEYPIINETFIKGDFIFELSEPKMMDVINYEMMIEMIDSDKDLRTSIDSRKMKVANYPVQFLKKIKMKGEDIEDFSKLKFTEKIEFIDALPPDVVYGDGETLTHFVLEKFPPTRFNHLFQKVKCVCGIEGEGVVSTSNFFTI